jgi:hypothetical protein
MTYFEVLVEGGSDVPVLHEILTRKFNLRANTDFRIHPHKGRGKLPIDFLGHPDPKHQALLDQLPAKLRGFSYLGDDSCVVVVVDVDDTPPQQLLDELESMLGRLPKRPKWVMFGLVAEETESWFIADERAILKAFPRAKVQKLRGIQADAIVGAWEMLAAAVGAKREEVTGADKHIWAAGIAPHLDLETPNSPSLKKFIDDIRLRLDVR